MDSDEGDGVPDQKSPTESPVAVGSYTWAEFVAEYGHADALESTDGDTGRDSQGGSVDWDAVSVDPESYLGFHPDGLEEYVLPVAGDGAAALADVFHSFVDPETTPVLKDHWLWEHYKWEYYYEPDGSRPRSADGEIIPHDPSAALGFDPDVIDERLATGGAAATALAELVDERTVNVRPELDEDAFFSNEDGTTTITNRYDLEKAVPMAKKRHFREVERYWVNQPYAFVIIFHSEKENEKKYYVVEPYLTEIETELREFLSGKLRTAIKYSDEGIKRRDTDDGRRSVIEAETRRLLKRYDLTDEPERQAESGDGGLLSSVTSLFGGDEQSERDASEQDDRPTADGDDDLPADTDVAEANPESENDPADQSGEGRELDGISVRPEPVVLAEDSNTLSEYQVEKLLYLLKRNFIGYERIDSIKHDINVEDISCDGYNSPVFVYHTEYEQIISNVFHGETELDDFVVKLAQRSGKGISKRSPQVDATLPDGSRAQLTLGTEVSDHGTNYTIRQFKDVPFTPIDLINWHTFSLEEMALLWLCIENHKSLLFAGGTASGKTTSLNAVSLFIPSSAKIVSIEDTREVELPQRNWIASVTRPSFADDEQGDVDEFDLLEAALRQRPDYIVMGEIRGEEGRTLFQVMSTGHTTYTTFHADSVDEVLKRFTTDPINVSKTMFTALDLVSIQTQTRVQGQKVRRNKSLTEINHYEAEHDEINVQDVYQWQAESDEYLKMGDSNTLAEIRFDRGWSPEKLQRELFKREVILAYLIINDLNSYAEVAATVQAFINDPETILRLIANGKLQASLEDLREMESVLIDVDPEKEALVPRPEAGEETRALATDILERAEEQLFDTYRGEVPDDLESALSEEATAETQFAFDDESGGTELGWGDVPLDEESPLEGSSTDVSDLSVLPAPTDGEPVDELAASADSGVLESDDSPEPTDDPASPAEGTIDNRADPTSDGDDWEGIDDDGAVSPADDTVQLFEADAESPFDDSDSGEMTESEPVFADRGEEDELAEPESVPPFADPSSEETEDTES